MCYIGRIGDLFISEYLKLTLENKKARVECKTEAGARDLYEMETPCVIGAGKGLNAPGYPTSERWGSEGVQFRNDHRRP